MKHTYSKRVISFVLSMMLMMVAHAAFSQPITKTHTKSYKRALAVDKTLLLHPKFAEGTMYACINSYYRQGLPFAQVVELCSVQLQIDGGKGFGSAPDKGLGNFGRGQSTFDPSQVSAVCASGDPRQGKDPAPYSGPVPWSHHADSKKGDYKVVDGARVELFGEYSWGGPGPLVDAYGRPVKNKDGDELVTKGLTKEESEKIKVERVQAAKDANAAYYKKCVAENASGTPDECIKLRKDADDKNKEAEKDPNVAPKGTGLPSQGHGSMCETVLAMARETLRECNRNGWKSTQCQQLSAKMNHCPDPTYIYVDPEQGYACGAKIDPRLVVQAAVEHCRKTTKPFPDGRDPCAPPTVSGSGRVMSGSNGNICSNPYAYVDDSSNACIVEIKVGGEGRQDIESIILLALNKFGGPIFVLPRRNPTPTGPKPEPRPGPRPH